MIKKIAFVMIACMGLTILATAQTRTPRATKRQINQNARIAQGKRTGELTRQESRQLRRQQRNIQRTKRIAKSDGKVTKRERAIINSKQKRANRNIRRKKNNLRTR